MKRRKEKISALICYDYLIPHLREKAGLDMLFVADSIIMVVYGYKSTASIGMNEMMAHKKAVPKGAPNTFLYAGMPFWKIH